MILGTGSNMTSQLTTLHHTGHSSLQDNKYGYLATLHHPGHLKS